MPMNADECRCIDAAEELEASLPGLGVYSADNIHCQEIVVDGGYTVGWPWS
jgi:hypothetical protein